MGPALLAALVVTEVFGGDRALVLDERSIGVAPRRWRWPCGPPSCWSSWSRDGERPWPGCGSSPRGRAVFDRAVWYGPGGLPARDLPRGTGTHRSCTKEAE